MISFGRSIRWYNDYNEEVRFSKENNFDFMQIWFLKGEILIDKLEKPKEKYILEAGYPVIVHAVYDIEDYEIYTDELIKILKYFGHNEVIIHPVCESIEIDKSTIHVMAEKIYNTNKKLKEHSIKLYIENNSIIDTINYKPEDLSIIFTKNPDVELLLDIAHIDDYNHLEEIIKIKYPTCLHVADKRFSVEHEHLPLGQGDLDFNLIFEKYLSDFQGRVIFEVVSEDENIVKSKDIIEKVLQCS